MMKQTSQSGKNVKFERFNFKKNFRAFEAKYSIYFFIVCNGSKYEKKKCFIKLAVM